MDYIISNDISDDWSLIYLPCVRIAFDSKVRSLVCKHIDDEIFYVNNLIDYLRENYQETYDSYVGRVGDPQAETCRVMVSDYITSLVRDKKIESLIQDSI